MSAGSGAVQVQKYAITQGRRERSSKYNTFIGVISLFLLGCSISSRFCAFIRPKSCDDLRAGMWRDGVRMVRVVDGVQEPLVQRARCRLLRQWVGASMGRERWDGRQLRLCCSIQLYIQS